MLGKPYRPDGGPHCRVEVNGILLKNLYPIYESCVCLCCTHLRVMDYSQDSTIKKNVPAISLLMDVFRWVFFCL